MATVIGSTWCAYVRAYFQTCVSLYSSYIPSIGCTYLCILYVYVDV